jgi:23S rRNA (pseudouridine1915-N3)-methyltransferase
MQFAVTIVSIGRKNDILDEEIARYHRLLRPYASLSIILLKPPCAPEMPLKEQLIKEGKLLQSKWPPMAYSVALSEEGKSMTSVGFSQWLSGKLSKNRPLIFTIGGAYGLSPQLKEQCKELVSLSPMTLPHKLCMVVLTEQIYRAFTILHHHPYHK